MKTLRLIGGMFAPVQSDSVCGRHAAFAVSVAVHGMLLALLAYRPAPPLLQPSGSLRGEGGRGSVQMLYLPGRSVTITDPRQRAELGEGRLSPPPKVRKRRGPAPIPEPAASGPETARAGRPGTPLGSLSSGIASAHDVRIALPVFAPEPPVVRAKLPEWLRGDVIVEVTIDEHGAVVDARVLQSAGFGLEEPIVDTLRQWRFIPAKIDGVAVASRQDVHFHFPS
jgi:TonB family protein